jgi:hypothetical protein
VKFFPCYGNEQRRRNLETLIFLEAPVRSVSGSAIDTRAVGADRAYRPHWPSTKSLVPFNMNSTRAVYNVM